MLNFYIEFRMKVTKFHRGVRFLTKSSFADYIIFNTDKRSAYNKSKCKLASAK